MRNISILIAIGAMIASCGGSNATREKEAVAVAAVAGAAQVVSLARSQSPDSQKSAKECCVVCDKCSFPCGDRCLPNGSVCMKPKGCACYASDIPVAERPSRPDYDMPCTPAAIEGEDQAPVTPIVPIISY